MTDGPPAGRILDSVPSPPAPLPAGWRRMPATCGAGNDPRVPPPACLTGTAAHRSNMRMIEFAIVPAAYLIGSVASAIVVCRAMRLPDPRGEGSGNPGATNVLRIGGKVPAAATLAGDVLKGVLPVLVAGRLTASPTIEALAALGAFVGHLYPLYFRFQGGKGVATMLGAITALAWPVGCVMCALWLVVAATTRYASLASMTAAVGAPIAALWLAPGPASLSVLTIIAALVLWRHRANIRRLGSGTESRIGQRSTG